VILRGSKSQDCDTYGAKTAIQPIFFKLLLDRRGRSHV